MAGHSSLDEEQTIRQCLSGDAEAFSVLVERYKIMAYTVAYRVLGDADAANDAAQDSFIAAFKSLKHFRFGSKFSTWLYSIVVNKCRDRLRAEKDTVPVDDIRELRADPAGTPEQRALEGETRSEVQAALSALPAEYREVLVLKHIQGLAYAEMADILGASIAALKVRAHRGREMLRAVMEKAGIVYEER